jgi:hypothetical protein
MNCVSAFKNMASSFVEVVQRYYSKIYIINVSMHSTFHLGVHQGNFIFNFFKRQTFIEYSVIKDIIFTHQTRETAT